MGEVDRELDLTVFGRSVSWAVQQFSSHSMGELVHWMAGHLDDDGDDRATRAVREKLLELIHFHSPEQRDAERHVCEVLERDLRIPVTRWNIREEPGRSVDWARTYMNAHTDPPRRYYCRERTTRPDGQLRSALVWEAEQWLELLQSYAGDGAYVGDGQIKRRINRLSETLEQVREKYDIDRQPLDRAKLNRLSRQGEAGRRAAAVLNRLAVHRYSAPDTDKLAEAFERALDETEGWWKDDQQSSPLNNMFEFSALATIAEIADNHAEWDLKAIDRDAPFEAELHHVTRPIVLTIGKSFTSPVAPDDTFVELQELAGMTKDRDPSGGQPDLRLTFYDRDDPKRNISVLGDTKRNSSGKAYFQNGVRTAAYYMAAFIDAIDAEIEDGRLVGAIRPTFTLFFRHGIETPDAVRRALDPGMPTPQDDLPPMLAFQLQDLSSGQEDDSVLVTWFDTLSMQALDYLT